MKKEDMQLGLKVKVNVTDKKYKLSGVITEVTDDHVIVEVPTYYGIPNNIVVSLTINNGETTEYMARVL